MAAKKPSSKLADWKRTVKDLFNRYPLPDIVHPLTESLVTTEDIIMGFKTRALAVKDVYDDSLTWETPKILKMFVENNFSNLYFNPHCEGLLATCISFPEMATDEKFVELMKVWFNWHRCMLI